MSHRSTNRLYKYDVEKMTCPSMAKMAEAISGHVHAMDEFSAKISRKKSFKKRLMEILGDRVVGKSYGETVSVSVGDGDDIHFRITGDGKAVAKVALEVKNV